MDKIRNNMKEIISFYVIQNWQPESVTFWDLDHAEKYIMTVWYNQSIMLQIKWSKIECFLFYT